MGCECVEDFRRRRRSVLVEKYVDEGHVQVKQRISIDSVRVTFTGINVHDIKCIGINFDDAIGISE